ncbi:g5352 [Coccomyxa viridis]|uniref:G5352 protein n=1 Tax=Coccomyxa viridis TaxID=1274662 RepID=A0ABP1FVE6_9CHLO
MNRTAQLSTTSGSVRGAHVRGPLAQHSCTAQHRLVPSLHRQVAWKHELSSGQSRPGTKPQAAAQEFPAATVDYDADSDSVEEFSSGDEAPMDFLDFDESEFPEDPQGEAALEAAAEEEGEETEEEGDEDEEDEDDPPVASSSGQGPIIEVAGMPSWGDAALESAQSVLQQPDLEGLQLYSFRAAAKRDRLYIRLDKLKDKYGSPSLDEVSLFSREFYNALEAKIGEQAAGELSVEVSSPGAERTVRVPSELERFRELPMLVTHEAESEKGSRVLRLIELDTEAGSSVWGLANVRVNRDKRQKLTKKQETQRFEIPLSAIKQARLHLDA